MEKIDNGMLVRILLLKYDSASDDYDYDEAKYIGAYYAKDVHTTYNLFREIKEHEDVIEIDEAWYLIQDCVMVVPRDHETLECINLYVSEYV